MSDRSEMPASTPTTIIVPLDGSTRAERSLVPLGTLASRLHAQVAFLMAATVDDRDTRPGYLEGVMAQYGFAGASMILDSRAPEDAIIDALETTPDSLLWLPTHARSGAALITLGGIADPVISRTTEALVLAGPNVDGWDATTRGPVLLCFDGSPGSADVAPDAMAWAARFGAAVHVVTVLHHDGAYIGDVASDRVRRAADELVASLGGADAGVALHLLDGINPATAIPDHARDVQAILIVTAAHTHQGVTHSAFGSVALRVAKHAECPVLVRHAGAVS